MEDYAEAPLPELPHKPAVAWKTTEDDLIAEPDQPACLKVLLRDLGKGDKKRSTRDQQGDDGCQI
jgi:hypothetical protein